MWREAYDRATGNLVGSLARATDADYEALEQSVRRVLSESSGRVDGIACVFFIEDGENPPNALWRKRLGEARAIHPTLPRLIAYVTATTQLRWMLTALQWVAPLATATRHQVVGTWEEARRWMAANASAERVETLETLRRELLTGGARSSARMRVATASGGR